MAQQRGFASILGQYSSGDVQSDSESDYQGELSFSFSVTQSGEISGGGSGSYTDANWHLFGVNGDKGSFDCNPPITADAFKVDVSGQATRDQAAVSLSMPGATETNENFDCGADYTGEATTTHAISDSLTVVGGDHLDISLGAPTSIAKQKTTSSGSGGDTENDQHLWSFSFTPPGTQSTGAGLRMAAAEQAERKPACYGRRMPSPTEPEVEQVVEQTIEIEEVVGEALELLGQIRYSLQTLEDRLKTFAEARQRK
jgi:hypothetical protein